MVKKKKSTVNRLVAGAVSSVEGVFLKKRNR